MNFGLLGVSDGVDDHGKSMPVGWVTLVVSMESMLLPSCVKLALIAGADDMALYTVNTGDITGSRGSLAL